MPVYLAGAPGASTTCPGCLCRDRVPRYPSDMTDAQWRVLEPQARAVMDEIRRAAGRPMVHDLRAMVDAVGYVVRNGIEWRALPVGLPAVGGGVRGLPTLEPAGPAAAAGGAGARAAADRA